MSSHKRKRSRSHSQSHASSQPPSPSPILNPNAHNESTLKQLRVAGLKDSALLPSTYIPQFPHRPITHLHSQHNHPDSDASSSSSASSDDDDQANNDGDSSPPPPTSDDDADDREPKSSSSSSKAAARRRHRRASAMRTAQTTHLAVLTATVHRALAENDGARARRAFGLVRRSDVRGKPVDLRRGGLWALGVEVLMMQRHHSDEDEQQEGRQGRWGGGGGGAATENMPAVREYLEALIRLYPYNRLHPRAVSDVDFWPVLFGCEVYCAWAEQKTALERLDGEEEDGGYEEEEWAGDDVDMLDEQEEEDSGRHLSPRERRVRQAKVDLASRTLEAMHAVAMRMDGLLADAPYSRSAEMWRLRGMVALYMGDLNMPPSPRTNAEEERGLRVRNEERERAGRFFRKMREHGGRVDAFTDRWLGGDHDDDSGTDNDGDEDMGGSAWSDLPVFSSMPMR